jgi:gamma-butyrobetaine dioxygenase
MTTLDTTVPIAAVDLGPHLVTITWADDSLSRFHHMWLRDNSPQAMHTTTKHRVEETSEIPDDVHPASAELIDGDLVIFWAHDGHESRYSAEWLHRFDYSRGARIERTSPILWDASIGELVPQASYPELLADPEVRRQYMAGFLAYGVGILHDVPTEPGTVLNVAAEFGEVRTTSWGTVFDVRSMTDANSVAYTNLRLVTHTDEGYRNPAPTIQLQHFLVSETSGGMATLVDGFKIAEDLRSNRPDYFELLSTVLVHYHFADATAEHENVSPIIRLDPDGSIKQIQYSNHSATPFLVPFDQMEAFYEAYRAFGRMRESDEYQLRINMGAGDMYMVDNHRVLHGRTSFSSGGARHLQSCYIERDEFASRLTVMSRNS